MKKKRWDMLPYHTDGASRYPSKLWCASLLFLIAHWRLQNDPFLYCTLNLITIILDLLFSFTLRSVTSLTEAVLSFSKLTHYCFLKEMSLLANASQIHLAKSVHKIWAFRLLAPPSPCLVFNLAILHRPLSFEDCCLV